MGLRVLGLMVLGFRDLQGLGFSIPGIPAYSSMAMSFVLALAGKEYEIVRV